MTQSSNTCDTHGSADSRNCVGYAIRELYLGTLAADGTFNDFLHHSPDQKQTLTYCSSVDSWHAPSDLYVAPDRMESGDQPGWDLFFTSGITRGLPAIIPVAMLYSTDRILVTHAGSLPRPSDLRAMVVAKSAGEAYDAAALDALLTGAVAQTVRRQAEWNKPVWWPMVLLTLALVGLLLLAARSFKRRERMNARGEVLAA